MGNLRGLGGLVLAPGGALGAPFGVSLCLLPECEVESETGTLPSVKTWYVSGREALGKDCFLGFEAAVGLD